MALSHQDVTAFIESSFRSVWDLELLRQLRGSKGVSQPSDKLVSDLRASEVVVSKSLDALLAAGLIVIDANGAALYSPVSEELDRLSLAAEELYGRSPDSVRRMIVRSSAPGISAFADAFRLRKD